MYLMFAEKVWVEGEQFKTYNYAFYHTNLGLVIPRLYLYGYLRLKITIFQVQLLDYFSGSILPIHFYFIFS